MNKLLLIVILSMTSLVVLKTMGIQTEILVVDQWVDTVMGLLSIKAA